ncbi:MAG TPA: NADH:ubiquinone reductase (Na(+)-transporting) subunit E [Bacteroidetes bacterium]|jgi:Na+-transporting NADH:ubiquinone oxidoreductase subunit E|nr:MAG: Na(+)-translocating NADH-quinone reductase subunit E [Sphingobacteriales bacterium BACL12 MAG-120802-bin5]KRP12692.1 MAG: Na(+)-translocating NADH-quinone reductase subunit E [Sphingobacteriales bacterium BACL12 MAG-120813-bin55]HCK22419.1 NADH:ubiquinone reductase (Na(+)-transporting) subunit E [Bacteroidota bacterium]
MEYVNIFIKASFIENMVLSFFLGMCSFLAISKKVKTAVGLGAAVVFVLGITVPINWIISNKLLSANGIFQTDLTFLKLIIYISVIAAMVQLVEMVVEKFSPSLYSALGIFLPLITVNCAILGGSLFMDSREYELGEASVFGLGSGFGFFLAIVAIAAIREKLRYADIPAPLRGLGIAFIITGLMGLAFMSFIGIKL